MSHQQHPASPPSPYPGPTFQRIRRPGGHPPGHRGQPNWVLRALYGATSVSLLAGPVHAGGYYKEQGPARATVEATDGNPDHMVRVQGPIITQGEREHGVRALQAGSAVLTGPIVTSGSDAYAVYYSGAARVMMTDVDITTTGERAHAVQGFRGLGPDLPEWAVSQQGDLEWRRGTITLQGRASIGVDVTAPIARLGRPLQETNAARLWGMGYTRQASAQEPDVRIEGRGLGNTGIAITGHRRMELNGARIALLEAGAVGMSVGPAARVDGKNIGITASEPGSFGLRVRGHARGDDGARCPAPTSVKLANGFITMTGRDSPAVELTRAEVSLEDIAIATAHGARFAVGNEAGKFRMQGKQARATIRSTGSALAAWTANDSETASFDFRNVSIHSGSGSLLEVGRDRGDSGPALPARVDLSLDGADAQGKVWSSVPDAPRVDITLKGRASWQGHTAIGRSITVEERSIWQMDADSTVDDLVMDRGTISFHDGPPMEDQPSGPAAADREAPLHRLHVLRDMRGDGEVHMRADAANGESDRIEVDGSASGNITVRVRDTGTMTEAVKAIDVLRAARGGPANYTLPNRAKRVFLARQPFELHKETARDDPSVTVWLVPKDMPYIRSHVEMDLPPLRGDPVVVAEMGGHYQEHPESIDLPASPKDAVPDAETPAGLHGTFTAMHIDPDRVPNAPVHAPPPTQGEPMPTQMTVAVGIPEVVLVAPMPSEGEIAVGGTGNGDGTGKDSIETGKERVDEIQVEAGAGGDGRDRDGDRDHDRDRDRDRDRGRNGGGDSDSDPDGGGGDDGDGDDDGNRDGDGDGEDRDSSGGSDAADKDDTADEGDTAGNDDKADKEEDATDQDADEDEPGESAPEAPTETAAVTPPAPVVLTPGARLAVNNSALAAGQSIWNAQLGAINRQLRASRNSGATVPLAGIHALDASGTGIWIDAADSRQKIDNPLTGDYRQNLYGFVVGIDRAIDVAAGRWHIGLLASQVNSNRDFTDGKGSTRSVHAGGYATFLGPQGSYATAIVAAGRYRHRMHGKAANDARITGSFRNQGAGVSVEAGRRVELPRAWFVEPYAGMDYLRVGGARYSLSDGTSVRDHGGHSLQWHAGSRVGRTIDTGNGNTVTPYLRAGYAYEQGNRNRITVDGATLDANLGGSRFEAGVGVEARLSKGHSLYADFGYGKGNRLEQARTLIVGFQYRW